MAKTGKMKATITSIELKGPFKFFPLSMYAWKVTKQLQDSKNLEFKKTGFWMKHYTMTLWPGENELKDFARSGAHLEAMKNSRKIAREIRTFTYDTEELPDWRSAKKMLENGKVLTFMD